MLLVTDLDRQLILVIAHEMVSMHMQNTHLSMLLGMVLLGTWHRGSGNSSVVHRELHIGNDPTDDEIRASRSNRYRK